MVVKAVARRHAQRRMAVRSAAVAGAGV
jgi:hypothetical protein